MPLFILTNLISDKSALLLTPLAKPTIFERFSSTFSSYIPGLFTAPRIETRFDTGLTNTRSPDLNLVEKFDVPPIKVS